jgi:pimeloyl-ACP methyl ester carboxylesterase
MEKITINRIQLAYTRQGQGTPLLLLHGYPLDHTIWENVLAQLVDTFDVICPDLRGFGESEIMAPGYEIADMALDLAGLLDSLGIDKACIAGHSMGGYVALAFTRQFPARVLGLGLVASQTLDDPADRKAGRYATIEQIKAGGVAVVEAAMAPKLSADAKVREAVSGLILRQKAEGCIGTLRAMAERPDNTDLMGTIASPVVLIHGDADVLIPVERAREIKAQFPKTHLVELPGAGHMPMMEFPKETALGLKKLLN